MKSKPKGNGGNIAVANYNNSNQHFIFSQVTGTQTATTGSNTCSVSGNAKNIKLETVNDTTL